MKDRLKDFRYDDSLAAASARAIPREVLADDEKGGLPEQISKCARLATASVLISSYDMTEEEEDHYEQSDDDPLDELQSMMAEYADVAFESILGKDHGIALTFLCAIPGYEDANYLEDPTVFLHSSEEGRIIRDHHLRPKVQSYDLTAVLPTPSTGGADTTDVDGKIDRVLKVLSLEAEGRPGWKLMVVNSSP
jgi:hypothetical protein